MKTFDGDIKFKFSGCEERIIHNPTERELVMVLEMLKTQISNGLEIDNIDIKRHLRSL